MEPIQPYQRKSKQQSPARRAGSSRASLCVLLLALSLLYSPLASASGANAAGGGQESRSGGAFDTTHEELTRELQKYVAEGLVDYKRWKRDPAPLKRYLDKLQTITPEQYGTLSKSDRKALWLNAYNAFTIWLVLRHYPIEGKKKYYPKSSIRQVQGFWEDNFITIAGRKVSLAQIEHNVLRREFRDPRTHFAVVCAAMGCARLSRVAFKGRGLERALERATREFLARKENVFVDTLTGTVHVSKIFLWFPLDFSSAVGLGAKFPPPTDDQIVVSYLRAKGSSSVKALLEEPPKGTAFKVVYDPYDWQLNEYKCTADH